MAIELASGARESASVAGNVFTLLGEDTTSISFLEAMAMTYATSGDTLTRVSTLHGSNSASAVTFSGDVTIYRTITEFDVTPKALTLLQRGEVDLSGLVSTGSATSLDDACTSETITPLSTTSTLWVRWYANGLTVRDGTSGTTAVTTISAAYVSSAPATVTVGGAYNCGIVNLPADVDQGSRFVSNAEFSLASNQQNATGDWEIKLRYLVNNSATDFTLQNAKFVYEECV